MGRVRPISSGLWTSHAWDVAASLQAQPLLFTQPLPLSVPPSPLLRLVQSLNFRPSLTLNNLCQFLPQLHLQRPSFQIGPHDRLRTQTELWGTIEATAQPLASFMASGRDFPVWMGGSGASLSFFKEEKQLSLSL